MVNQEAQVLEEVEGKWMAGHLYYHQNLDVVVTHFVAPLVVYAVKKGLIDGFFFVRYGLGGPHVRLRLRAVSGAQGEVVALMQEVAEEFLEQRPSTNSVDEAVIERVNNSILAGDPNETDDAVYPDNSFRLAPFRPEVARYGGLDHFWASLDFFTLSSVAAVEFLSKCGGTERSTQLLQAFRLLLEVRRDLPNPREGSGCQWSSGCDAG